MLPQELPNMAFIPTVPKAAANPTYGHARSLTLTSPQVSAFTARQRHVTRTPPGGMGLRRAARSLPPPLMTTTRTGGAAGIQAMFKVDAGSETLAETLGAAPVRIALTRELGKNDALREALEMIDETPEVLELPCVATMALPGAQTLPTLLSQPSRWTWMVVTSPEGASFFVDGWRRAGCPPLAPARIAAVGAATAAVIRAVGLDVAFKPSKATGKTLVSELPPAPTTGHDEGDGGGDAAVAAAAEVLYGVSGRAGDAVEIGLRKLGYSVERVDTYTTVTRTWTAEEVMLGRGTDIVTFASPSAVSGWVANVGHPASADTARSAQQEQDGRMVVAACIGETSAKAAKEAGFSRVLFADSPGVDGWVLAVCEALRALRSEGGTADGEP